LLVIISFRLQTAAADAVAVAAAARNNGSSQQGRLFLHTYFSRPYTTPSEAHERFRTTDGIRPDAAAAVVKDEGRTD
jgi:hypothetical protein